MPRRSLPRQVKTGLDLQDAQSFRLLMEDDLKHPTDNFYTAGVHWVCCAEPHSEPQAELA